MVSAIALILQRTVALEGHIMAKLSENSVALLAR
jgi:hypothetical protein